MRVNTKDDPRYQKMAFGEFKNLVDRHMLRLMEHCGIMQTHGYDLDMIKNAWQSGHSTLCTARRLLGIEK